jgi:hypothetical protein
MAPDVRMIFALTAASVFRVASGDFCQLLIKRVIAVIHHRDSEGILYSVQSDRYAVQESSMIPGTAHVSEI